MRRAQRRRGLARELGDLPGAKRASPLGFVAPCLATPSARVPDGDEWIHEIKHDGYRIQAHLIGRNVTLYTRRGYDWTARFPALARAVGALPEDAITDGELVALNDRGIADFHLLEKAIATGATDSLHYFAFDLLYASGYDVRESPLAERKRLLEDLLRDVPESGPIRLNTHIQWSDPATLFERACGMHLEGIVSKDRTSPYRSGRQMSWLKTKCIQSDNFPIVAFVEKLGAQPRRIASLYLGRRENGRLLYAGKAQTGFEDWMLYDLRERLNPYIRASTPLDQPIRKPKATWVEPVIEAEVSYSGRTADGLLRAPVYKGLRRDLGPPDVARSASAPSTARRGPPRVPKENILQLLPDAVVPSREQLDVYWRKVAPRALEYLGRRPLKLVRHVHGTTFYHMGPLPPRPPGVHELKVQKREGGEGTRLWIDDLEGLLGLVQMGAVELHPWNSTVDDLEHPDVMVFDLDPGRGIEWAFVVDTALELRALLKSEGYSCWPKLTGGKGIHLMVPLGADMTHDEAHRYSRALATRFAGTNARYTTTASLAQRSGRLFIDFLRNGRGTTAIGTYSPRARSGFPIAARVSWAQIERGIQPDAFTMENPPRASRRESPSQAR